MSFFEAALVAQGRAEASAMRRIALAVRMAQNADDKLWQQFMKED